MLACSLLIAVAAAPLHAQFIYQDLYDFNCSPGACNPSDIGSLTQASDGSLLGTTTDSTAHVGALFDVTTTAPVVYSDSGFSNPIGANPFAGPIVTPDGILFGTTTAGGANGWATVFAAALGTVKVLHDFTGAEGLANCSPVQGKDGNLYGTTSSGAIYQISIPSFSYTVLPNKAPILPVGPLLLSSDGNLYGTTVNGGKNQQGTIFRLTTPSGAIKILHTFSGPEGASPYAPHTQAPDGNVYGTTFVGGMFCGFE